MGGDEEARRKRDEDSEASLRSAANQMRSMGFGADEIAAELARRSGAGPRTAYRIAAGMTLEEAARRIRSYEARSGPAGLDEMTSDRLRLVEADVAGDSFPSAGTLAVLAQVYGTRIRNLVDLRDWQQLPAGDRLIVEDEPDSAPQSTQNLTALLVGQAAAILAVAAGVVYAAGALPLGLKLYFVYDNWQPVVAGLPRDIVFANAISTLVPTIAAAALIYMAYATCRDTRAMQRLGRRLETHALSPLAAALAVAILLTLLISPFLLHFTGHYFLSKNVLRPAREIFPVCLGINIFVILLAFFGLRLVRRSPQPRLVRHVFGTALIALALLPSAASVNAAFPLPKVTLCGPALNSGNFRRIDGNLIGDSNQWAFVAETIYSKTKKKKKETVTGHDILMIPLSEIRVAAVGTSIACRSFVNTRLQTP